MASNVCVFQSTDYGAPSLTGQVGTLISLLDACLVNGYGPVAITSMSRTDATVTVETSANHGFAMLATVGPMVQISGADQAEYNGRWRIASVPDTTHFTFDVGTATPVSPATGSLSCKRAAAGWQKVFAGTDKAVYRSQDNTSDRYYLRIDDTGATAGGAREAAVVGYEVMTDVDAGTARFPTSVQHASGLQWAKSSTADAVARAWLLIADEKTVYFSPAVPNKYIHGFGHFQSYKAGDLYKTFIAGNASFNTFTDMNANGLQISNGLYRADIGASGMYAARSYTQAGSAVNLVTLGSHQNNYSSYYRCAHGAKVTAYSNATLDAVIYPNPVDTGLYVIPIEALELVSGVVAFRGRMPGYYTTLHQRPLQHLDIVSGLVGLPGAVMVAVNHDNKNYSSMDGSGQVYFALESWD